LYTVWTDVLAAKLRQRLSLKLMLLLIASTGRPVISATFHTSSFLGKGRRPGVPTMHKERRMQVGPLALAPEGLGCIMKVGCLLVAVEEEEEETPVEEEEEEEEEVKVGGAAAVEVLEVSCTTTEEEP